MEPENSIELLAEVVRSLSTRIAALEISLGVAVGKMKNPNAIIAALQVESEFFLESEQPDQKKIGEALASLSRQFER